MNSRAEIILDFWFNQTPPEKRFKRDEAFDNEIREKFLKDYNLAKSNDYDDWLDNSKECRIRRGHSGLNGMTSSKLYCTQGCDIRHGLVGPTTRATFETCRDSYVTLA